MPNATILVVDDEPLIRWSLVNRLKEEGYRTVEAGTASDAVAHHRDGVDLVLLDYALPDANGLDVLKQVKEIDRRRISAYLDHRPRVLLGKMALQRSDASVRATLVPLLIVWGVSVVADSAQFSTAVSELGDWLAGTGLACAAGALRAGLVAESGD